MHSRLRALFRFIADDLRLTALSPWQGYGLLDLVGDLFEDGFEDGTTAAWSSAVGEP